MPIDIKFNELPAGYAESAAKGGDKVLVSRYGFYSSEDGDELITRLEGLPQQILTLSSPKLPILPSQIDTLLAIIHKDKTAQVYINEVKVVGDVRVKKKVEIGGLIFSDHILDMGRMRIEEVEIPEDAGLVFVFSVGWRKGFLYDLVPIFGNPPSSRDFDIEVLFGNLFSYLMFQERFKINEQNWESIYKQKWFPFSHLNNDLIKKMISHVKSGWEIDDLLPEISNNVKEIIGQHNLAKQNIEYFKEHASILEAGFNRYLDDDYISCVSILYPRIEGFLRSFCRSTGCAEKLSAEKLSEVAVAHHENQRINYSLLLPFKFNHYLNQIYFANFSPGTLPDVGRHSVAHGEARADDFNLKSATLAILTIYQLSIFMSEASRLG